MQNALQRSCSSVHPERPVAANASVTGKSVTQKNLLMVLGFMEISLTPGYGLLDENKDSHL